MFRWGKMLSLFTLLGMLLVACGSTAPTAAPTTAPAAAAPTAAPAAAAPTAAAATDPTAAPVATDPTAAPAMADATAAPAAGAGGKLEIFSWWTNGGEQEGLNAMFDI